MVPNTDQAASALDPLQRIELRFQKLTDLGLVRVKQLQKILGLPQISTQCGNTHDLHPLTHGHNIDPSGNSCPTNQQLPHT